MKEIITDPKKIDEVLERGVEKIYPGKKELRDLLLSGKKLRLYCGFDPSAPSLHVGNAVLINKLSQFQDLGHEVIFLIGDFTGMIGDPTDKESARTQKTRQEVTNNAKLYKKQAEIYLNFSGKNPARAEHNSKWQDKLNFVKLVGLSSNFTVQQMIIRDMFQERIKQEKPIYLHEFLYPLAQAYDSVALDVDLEVGGNDQMFNMMCGRDLQKAINKKDKHVLTMKLLADDHGKKMGKSEGNAAFLNETPENMYGIIMSWPDGVIGIGFELVTKIPLEEVKKIQEELKSGKTNPRDLKMKLAFEITKLVHGEPKAQKAQKHFINTFQKKEIPDNILEIRESQLAESCKKIKYVSRSLDGKFPKGAPRLVLDILVITGLASSKNEARRLIRQKAIKIDGKIVQDENEYLSIPQKSILLQRGKRQFIRIIRG